MYSKEVIVAAEGSTRAGFMRSFQFNFEVAEAALEKFSNNVTDDPVHTLSWATDAFNAAAKRDVALQVIHLLQHSLDIKTIQTVLLDGIVNKAHYINNKSTSTCSNYMEECMLAARVEAYERFKHETTLD